MINFFFSSLLWDSKYLPINIPFFLEWVRRTPFLVITTIRSFLRALTFVSMKRFFAKHRTTRAGIEWMRWNARLVEDLFLWRVSKARAKVSSSYSRMWKFNGKSSSLLAYKKCYNSAFLPREISIARSPTIPPNTLSRDQWNQDVRENSSARGSKRFLFAPLSWFYVRHFSSRRVVLFSLMMMRKERTVICTKCIEGRTNKKFSSFASKFKNPKYLRFWNSSVKNIDRAKSTRGDKKKREKGRDFSVRLQVWRRIYIRNQRTRGQSDSFFGSLRRSLRKYFISSLCV